MAGVSECAARWSALQQDAAACLQDGPALYERERRKEKHPMLMMLFFLLVVGRYERVKQLRDPLLALSQKSPKETAGAVATWRQLNQDMPKRINALRLDLAKKN